MFVSSIFFFQIVTTFYLDILTIEIKYTLKMCNISCKINHTFLMKKKQISILQ